MDGWRNYAASLAVNLIAAAIAYKIGGKNPALILCGIGFLLMLIVFIAGRKKKDELESKGSISVNDSFKQNLSNVGNPVQHVETNINFPQPVVTPKALPNLTLHGYGMSPIGKEDGVWTRNGTKTQMAWLAFIRNASLDDRDVGSARVRAEIVYRPSATAEYAISSVAWVGHSEDTVEIKASQTKELVIATEIIFKSLWKFVTAVGFCEYHELWHMRDCELEVRLIDDKSGRPISPSYLFAWTWNAGDYRPEIKFLKAVSLSGN